MRKIDSVFSVIGTFIWLLILFTAAFYTVYRFITGNGDPFVPMIVVVLFAMNFNINSLLTMKRQEAENVNMILEKTFVPPQQNKRSQNPYLN